MVLVARPEGFRTSHRCPTRSRDPRLRPPRWLQPDSKGEARAIHAFTPQGKMVILSVLCYVPATCGLYITTSRAEFQS